MSRIVGFGFALLDAAAAIASVLSNTGMLMLLVGSTITSLLIATMSSTVRGMICPSYFWDEKTPRPQLARQRVRS